MAQTNVGVTQGSGKNIDGFSTTTQGNVRQSVVVADPSVDAAVAGVVSADPGPSSTAYGQIVRLAGSAQVQIAGSSGSIAVYFDRGNPSVSIGGSTGSLAVYFDRGNPSVNIQSQTSTINVALDPGHTLGNIATLTSVTNTVAVYFDRGNPSVTVANVGTGSIGVFYSPSNPSVSISNSPTVITNAGATASIFTVSGSAAGVGLGGNTIISPSANYSFKIFAFQLTSTAQTNLLAKFTNGASSGPTEFWRMPLWAPAQGVMGGNLAVSPPGYLWATGTSTTLALLLDSASLVHYSVSYFKETS